MGEALQSTYQTASGFWQTTLMILAGPLKIVVQDLLPLMVCMALFYIFRKSFFDWRFQKNQQALYEHLAEESVLDGHPGK